MFPNTYTKAQLKKCPECQCVHHSKFNCKEVNCLACSGTHNIKEFIQGNVCPILYQQTQHLRETSTIPCPECKGLGNYQKIEEVWVKQEDKDYERRVEEWKEKAKKNPSLQKPQQMKFRRTTGSTIISCTLCEKQGIITKMKHCCFWGCSLCNFKKIKSNTVWRKVKTELKKRDVKVSKESICSICTEVLPVQAIAYPTECGHQFHKECLIKWFKIQAVPIRTCPICRAPDEFYPANYYDETWKKQSSTVKYYDEENVLNFRKNRSRSRDNKAIDRNADSNQYKEKRQLEKRRESAVIHDYVQTQPRMVEQRSERSENVSPSFASSIYYPSRGINIARRSSGPISGFISSESSGEQLRQADQGEENEMSRGAIRNITQTPSPRRSEQ